MSAEERGRLKRGQIGERVLRLEDGPLLAGAGTFAADWSFPDTLHMRVVRASVAQVCGEWPVCSPCAFGTW